MTLGLPDGVTACLFDLDGVLTDTATVHSAAWKQMFDEYLRRRDGDGFSPFTPADYQAHVDGKPRVAGVRDFLASRGVELPDGSPGDAPDEPTLSGLGNRKDALVQARIAEDGVEVFEGSRRYLEAARDAGLRRWVVSSSANTELVLRVTGLAPLVEGRVDGVTIRERSLRGKPAPDTFLLGADEAGADPSAAAVFEDALAGVRAGAAGRFGLVVGVDRTPADVPAGPDGLTDHGRALRDQGADVVVRDLDELLAGPTPAGTPGPTPTPTPKGGAE